MSGFFGSTGSSRAPEPWGLRESWRGRSEGIMNRTSDASVNWTTICRHVVKSGNGKMFFVSPSPFSSLNIHLLYTDIEIEKRYLVQLA
jgi:hypothetical protein